MEMLIVYSIKILQACSPKRHEVLQIILSSYDRLPSLWAKVSKVLTLMTKPEKATESRSKSKAVTSLNNENYESSLLSLMISIRLHFPLGGSALELLSSAAY